MPHFLVSIFEKLIRVYVKILEENLVNIRLFENMYQSTNDFTSIFVDYYEI